MSFRIAVVGGPCGPWIGRCLRSIQEQDYRGWTCTVVLDKFDDAPEQAEAIASHDSRFCVYVNEKEYDHRGALPNLLASVAMQRPGMDDVIVTVDADDWLSGPSVLSKVKAVYDSDPNLLITYGSWVGHPDPSAVNNSAPYHSHEFKDGSLRRGPWRGSHLRTFKHRLWSEVKDEDLCDSKGRYYECAWDLAFMWPMLEMAGYERSRWIPDKLYVYNRETPYNDEKMRSAKQYKNHLEIMAKTPYKLLP